MDKVHLQNYYFSIHNLYDKLLLICNFISKHFLIIFLNAINKKKNCLKKVLFCYLKLISLESYLRIRSDTIMLLLCLTFISDSFVSSPVLFLQSLLVDRNSHTLMSPFNSKTNFIPQKQFSQKVTIREMEPSSILAFTLAARDEPFAVLGWDRKLRFSRNNLIMILGSVFLISFLQFFVFFLFLDYIL